MFWKKRGITKKEEGGKNAKEEKWNYLLLLALLLAVFAFIFGVIKRNKV